MRSQPQSIERKEWEGRRGSRHRRAFPPPCKINGSSEIVLLMMPFPLLFSWTAWLHVRREPKPVAVASERGGGRRRGIHPLKVLRNTRQVGEFPAVAGDDRFHASMPKTLDSFLIPQEVKEPKETPEKKENGTKREGEKGNCPSSSPLPSYQHTAFFTPSPVSSFLRTGGNDDDEASPLSAAEWPCANVPPSPEARMEMHRTTVYVV